MILESNGRSSKRPVWGLLTGTLVLGWGAFVLCDAVTAEAQDRGPQVRRKVQPQSDSWPVLRDTGFEIKQRSDDLRARVAEFSSADVDGDGNLSSSERSALLVAIAMQSPDDVLKRFPHVDVDADGRLSVYEAVGWIDGHEFRPPSSPEVAAGGIAPLGEGGAQPKRVTVRESMRAQLDAAEWLFYNAASEPTTKQVAHYVEAIIEPRLAQMLEKIPDADLDGDGVLTEAERDSFMQQLSPLRLAHRAKLRERFVKQRAEAVEYGLSDEVLKQLDATIKHFDEMGEGAEVGLIALASEGTVKSKPGSLDARTVLRATKRVDLNRDQKDDIRDIEQETIGDYRKISRKDKQGHTELAERVKAEITKLLDAEQIEQFEAALKRFDRGSRQRDRKTRKP